jgi:hypothetical protein
MVVTAEDAATPKQKAAWLVTPDLRRLWLPDGGRYWFLRTVASAAPTYCPPACWIGIVQRTVCPRLLIVTCGLRTGVLRRRSRRDPTHGSPAAALAGRVQAHHRAVDASQRRRLVREVATSPDRSPDPGVDALSIGLVALAIQARMAQAAVPPGSGELVAGWTPWPRRRTRRTDELRELRHGIHSAVLARAAWARRFERWPAAPPSRLAWRSRSRGGCPSRSRWPPTSPTPRR